MGGNLPYSLNDFLNDGESFVDWINDNGGEIIQPTNQYEVIRVKGRNNKTLILYRNKLDVLRWPDELATAYGQFKKGNTWGGFSHTVKHKNNKKRIEALYKRDGDLCFYCQKPVDRSEASAEHILSRCHGGTNRLENMALSHIKCNQRVGDLPVIEKIKIRERFIFGGENGKAG